MCVCVGCVRVCSSRCYILSVNENTFENGNCFVVKASRFLANLNFYLDCWWHRTSQKAGCLCLRRNISFSFPLSQVPPVWNLSLRFGPPASIHPGLTEAYIKRTERRNTKWKKVQLTKEDSLTQVSFWIFFSDLYSLRSACHVEMCPSIPICSKILDNFPTLWLILTLSDKLTSEFKTCSLLFQSLPIVSLSPPPPSPDTSKMELKGPTRNATRWIGTGAFGSSERAATWRVVLIRARLRSRFCWNKKAQRTGYLVTQTFPLGHCCHVAVQKCHLQCRTLTPSANFLLKSGSLSRSTNFPYRWLNLSTA